MNRFLSRPLRMLATLLLTFAVSAGTLLVTSAPASAASYVEGCFKSNRAGLNVQGLGVQAQAYWRGSWYTIWNGYLGAPIAYGSPLSCVQINTGTANYNYPVRFVVSHRAGGATWTGVSPGTAPAGTGRWNVGTGVVTCFGCAY
jgi:hypothetical protein